MGTRGARRRVGGTQPYAAPEGLGGADPRPADMYALGVVLVEMASRPLATCMERARGIEAGARRGRGLVQSLLDAVPARRPLNLASAFSAYLSVLRTRASLGYMCASGIVFGALFAFIASSEQVIRQVFGKGETFTLWFAGVAGVMAIANFTNSRLVERLGMRRISHAALLLFTILSATLALSTLAFGENFALFFPIFAIAFGCFGLMGSNFSALAMEPLGKIAGTASAAYGFATTLASALIGAYIGQQFDGSTVPLMSGFACLGVSALVIVLITEKGQLFSTR